MEFLIISGKPINFGQINSPGATLTSLGTNMTSTFSFKYATWPWKSFTGKQASSTHRDTPIFNISLVVGGEMIILNPR